MRYGISIPNFGAWADPRTMVELARDAEAAGWDGFFLWDHIRFSATPLPVQDPWVLLAAIAALMGAFVFTAPGLLAVAGGLFVLAGGLFVLAPLRAMSRKGPP